MKDHTKPPFLKIIVDDFSSGQRFSSFCYSRSAQTFVGHYMGRGSSYLISPFLYGFQLRIPEGHFMVVLMFMWLKIGWFVSE